jgi:hypothetical protein
MKRYWQVLILWVVTVGSFLFWNWCAHYKVTPKPEANPEKEE